MERLLTKKSEALLFYNNFGSFLNFLSRGKLNDVDDDDDGGFITLSRLYAGERGKGDFLRLELLLNDQCMFWHRFRPGSPFSKPNPEKIVSTTGSMRYKTTLLSPGWMRKGSNGETFAYERS